MSSLSANMKRIWSKTAEKMWWRSFPHYKSMGIFSDAQGQLTLMSVVGSGRILNSGMLLCMSSLPASIKRIRSKTVEKTWWRPFPHYNPMGAIRCHGNQSSDLICIKTYCSLSPTLMMLQIKFGCNRPAGLGDIHVWKCGRTDAWTPAWVPSYKLTLWAFGSGELKMKGFITIWYNSLTVAIHVISFKRASHTCHKLWTETCEIRQIFKWDLIKFCEIFTKITLECLQNSQKPLF